MSGDRNKIKQKQLSVHQARRLAVEMARKHFGAFAEYVGTDDRGHPIKQAELHDLMWDFCEWAWSKGLYAGCMVPTGFGKTTQCQLRLAFEIGRDENMLGRIVGPTQPDALERVGAVREICDSDHFKEVFPRFRIKKGRAGTGAFTVHRSGLSKDPTLGGSGVITGTGSRTSFLMLDDVVTLKNALMRPSERVQVFQSIMGTWMTRQRLATDAEVRVVWIQTAYHQNDACARVQREKAKGWAWLMARISEPYEEIQVELRVEGRLVRRGTVAPVWDPEAVARMAQKMTSTARARALANQFLSGEEMVFQPAFFEARPPLDPSEYRVRVGWMDPCGDSATALKGDPDYCAIVTVGLHPTERRWDVIGCRKMRGTDSAQADFAARCAELHAMQRLTVESVTDSAKATLVRQALRREGIYIPVKAYKETRNKILRIEETLEPALRDGVLSICGARFPDIADEGNAFPAGGHDDCLDACSGAFGDAAALGKKRKPARTGKVDPRGGVKGPRMAGRTVRRRRS